MCGRPVLLPSAANGSSLATPLARTGCGRPAALVSSSPRLHLAHLFAMAVIWGPRVGFAKSGKFEECVEAVRLHTDA